MKKDISVSIEPEQESAESKTQNAESISTRIANLIPSEPVPQVKRIKLNDIELALYSTSPRPYGNWRTSWLIQLKRKPGRCKVPRGFGSFSV
ncbi:hypothetical protein [Vibrio parahaemolyticus]|uniref:hypothetical protein n=1 Tax=Vibrio parahaemolyticus TaxID=670 RepID=UPI0023EE1286|nr:hypothetical protein [Vibrio parahaemolyticus]